MRVCDREGSQEAPVPVDFPNVVNSDAMFGALQQWSSVIAVLAARGFLRRLCSTRQGQLDWVSSLPKKAAAAMREAVGECTSHIAGKAAAVPTTDLDLMTSTAGQICVSEIFRFADKTVSSSWWPGTTVLCEETRCVTRRFHLRPQFVERVQACLDRLQVHTCVGVVPRGARCV